MPGDRVIIMTPLYGPLQRAVHATGRELVVHALRPEAAAGRDVRQGRQERQGRYALDLPRLEADLRGARLLLLCSPHNPTGRVWSRAELTAVAAACARVAGGKYLL